MSTTANNYSFKCFVLSLLALHNCIWEIKFFLADPLMLNIRLSVVKL